MISQPSTFFDTCVSQKYQMELPHLHMEYIFCLKDLTYFGAGKGGRTLDLLVGNETLYH